jgi:hypothetical protein
VLNRLPACLRGAAHDQYRIEAAREIDELSKRRFHRHEQRVLEQQIFDRVR